MRQIVKKGSETATAEWAHSVHVEVDGLEPDRWYWYRFTTGGAESPVGRTRTLPLAASAPDRFRFAFVSCQNYEQGLFTAYDHLSHEDVDLIFHLGDYIYEGAGADGRVRKHAGPKLATLEHYRNRYAQYKSDPHLQAAHAARAVVRDPGRSRGAEQLRQRHLGTRRPTRRVPPPAGRRVPRVLRAPAVPADVDAARTRRASSTGRAAGARSRRSTSSTRGSSARTSRAATAPRRRARRRSTRTPRSWATSRSGGSSTACASPPRGGT